MIRELKNSHSYAKVMLLLSALTLVFGFLYCFLGEIFLPFAISFSAALFIFENPKKRVLSYFIPIIPVIIAAIFFGLFALITIQYAVYAILLALCYRYSKSKAYCALYLTFAIAVMMLVSLYISGAIQVNSALPQDVIDYYSTVYTELKGKIVDYLSGYSVTNKDGSIEKPISADVAGSYIDLISKFAVGIVGILAFLISGIAIKTFTSLILRYSKNGILKSFAHFLPSNSCAYIYIIVGVLSIFVGTTDTVDLTILNISRILMFVFAYMGIQYLLAVAKLSERRSTFLTFLVAGILLLNVTAIQLISYFGVWITIGTNRSLKPIDKE